MHICHARLARAAFLVFAVGALTFGGLTARDDSALAQRLPRLTLTVVVDGAERRISTSQTTVAGVLREAGIELRPLDRVVPALKDRLGNANKIVITRVTEQLVSVKQPISFDSAKTFSTSIRPGYVKESRQGVPGERLLSYRVRQENGVEVSRTRISSVVVKRPVSRVLAIGSRGRYTSRGTFRTSRVMRMSASAYDPGPKSCGKYATGRTACGLRAGYGVVAVDPRVVPLGTKLYVEGYGYAVAGDKGSAIKGARIDLGFNTNREAMLFGRKKVNVHVLE